MKLARFLLIINGLAFVATGFFALAAHTSFAEFVGYQLSTLAAETEFLGNYGGLYLFYGIYLVLCAVKQAMIAPGILVMVFTSLGLAFGRLVGFVMTNHIDTSQLVFAAWELVTAILCLVALNALRQTGK